MIPLSTPILFKSGRMSAVLSYLGIIDSRLLTMLVIKGINSAMHSFSCPVGNIYSEDKTQLYFYRIHQDDININSVIRQGCYGSPNLFFTWYISNLRNGVLMSKWNKYKHNILCKIVALFFCR